METIDEVLFLEMSQAAAHATAELARVESLGARAGIARGDLPRPTHHIDPDARHDFGGCAQKPRR